MNKKLFNIKEFNVMEIPEWTCPTCNSGKLKKDLFIQKDYNSLNIYENSWTTNARKHSDYWIDWDETLFYGYLVCTYCKEKVTICGNGRREEEDPVLFLPDQDILRPLFFNPALKIINININCLMTVKDLIEDSFKLYWFDLSSCANKIRISIEELLNIKAIRKTDPNRPGKRIPLSLDRRIILFKEENEKVARKLMAIKWIGNLGSHSGMITKEHILNAYEILESVIDDLYDDKDKRINRIVTSSIKSKGKKV